MTSKLERALLTWRQSVMYDALNKDRILKSISLLGKIVCVKEFPHSGTDIGDTAIDDFLEVLSYIPYAIQMNLGKRTDFLNPLFELMLKLISSGPGTVHLHIINMIFDTQTLNFRNYLRSLRGDTMKKLVSVCRRKFTCARDTPLSYYASQVMKTMSSVLETGLTDKQVQSSKAEFADLRAYFKERCQENQELKAMYEQMVAWIDKHERGATAPVIDETKLGQTLEDICISWMRPMNQADTLKAITELQGIICIEGFPSEKTTCGELAENCFGCILYSISETKGKIKPFKRPLFDLLIRLISSGPGTVHLTIIKDLYTFKKLDFEDYTRNLKGDDLKQLASVCKRKFSCEKRTSPKQYASFVKTNMEFVLRRGLTDQQVQACPEFAHLSTFFKEGFPDKSLEVKAMYEEMASWIDTHLKGETNTVAAGGFRVKLKHLQRVIQSENFPPKENQKNPVKVSSLLEALQEEGGECIKSVAEDLMDLVFMVYDRNPDDDSYRLVETVNNFLFCSKKGVSKVFQTKDFYLAYMHRLKTVILREEFPASEQHLKRFKKLLEYMLEDIDGHFGELHEELMDFVAEIIQQKPRAKIEKVVETFGYFFFNVDEKAIKGKPKIFEGVCTKLITILEGIREPQLLKVKFADGIVSDVLVPTMQGNDRHVDLSIRLVKVLVKHPFVSTIDAATNLLYRQEKNIKWKLHLDSVREILACMREIKVNNNKEIAEVYEEFVTPMFCQLRTARLLDELMEDMVKTVLSVIEKKNSGLYIAAQEIVTFIELNAKEHKGLVMGIFHSFDRMFKDNSYHWIQHKQLNDVANWFLKKAMDSVVNGNWLTEDDYQVLVSIMLTCFGKRFINSATGHPGTLFFNVLIYFLYFCLRRLWEINRIEWALPLVDPLMSMFDSNEPEVRSMAEDNVLTLCKRGGKILAPYMDKLLKTFFTHEKASVLETICATYDENPEPVNKELSRLVAYLRCGKKDVQDNALVIFFMAAKKHPELFTETFVEKLMEDAKSNPSTTVANLKIMEAVARRNVQVVVKVLPGLLEGTDLPESSHHALLNLLQMIGIRSLKHTDVIMDFFCKKLTGQDNQTITLQALDGIKNLGAVNIKVLAKHKDLIAQVKQKSYFPYVKDGCQSLLDIIEGRSLAILDEDLKETKNDVKRLDVKVAKTDKKVKVVTREVTKQKKEIQTVKKDVKVHDMKIGQLEETVDETVAKVEEIDSKTLSHAPFWARDVSKLLNPKTEHDWRLLSSRLGYSNDDIRGWAQQHDPCMAMLNEWYAVRKTSEATFAVLTALQEMDRMDAAIIVENAMKMAETVVEDEEFEYDEPPELFISYQWGMQNEVKLLNQHLVKAGYNCWMDIGQMGGGDKLFEKIDQGIRASKVIISCVTEKYAKSPNCNREVNLAVSLGKPIIPLLMEKQTWPPSGSMGPIFSEYLFIRFYTRPGEKSKGDRYWSPTKFQELLMQLNYNGIVPNESKIEKEYHNWWIPVVEEIKIQMRKPDSTNHQDSKGISRQGKVDSVSPDVFISYQWGKQKQIMLLYRRLMNLGFTCWMDIHQMGGGDSLYDKIDRGVRGCKIVLSCVTTKYSLSANCRREVSLADALKKPIVPLLLEKITWPPTGPMGMVFTQLLYINFSEDERVQDAWVGSEFNELLGQIRNTVSKRPEQTPASQLPQSKQRETKAPPSQLSEKNKMSKLSSKLPQSKRSGTATDDAEVRSVSKASYTKESQKQQIKHIELPPTPQRALERKPTEPPKSKSCIII